MFSIQSLLLKKLIRYYIVAGLSFLLNTFLVYIIADLFGYSYLYGIIITIILAIIIFFIHKKVTFRSSGSIKNELFYFLLQLLLINIAVFHLTPIVTSYINYKSLSYFILVLFFSGVSFAIQNIFIFTSPLHEKG